MFTISNPENLVNPKGRGRAAPRTESRGQGTGDSWGGNNTWQGDTEPTSETDGGRFQDHLRRGFECALKEENKKHGTPTLTTIVQELRAALRAQRDHLDDMRTIFCRLETVLLALAEGGRR